MIEPRVILAAAFGILVLAIIGIAVSVRRDETHAQPPKEK